MNDKAFSYYHNARELVKQNKPKEAREYLLVILQYVKEEYDRTSNIPARATMRYYAQKWSSVAQELAQKGVTDNVLRCFGLPTMQEQRLPKVEKTQPKSSLDKPTHDTDSSVNTDGLLENGANSQGWIAEVCARYKHAVVQVVVDDRRSGTGFIISDKGYLLTNHHVVCDKNGKLGQKAKMVFCDDKKPYALTITGFADKKNDVALCCFDPGTVNKFSVVKRISDYSRLQQGADCVVIGNTFGEGLKPSDGIISVTKDSDGDMVHSAPVNPGDSGGPVFINTGVCVGINKKRLLNVDGERADGISYATPMDKIDELLNKWSNRNGIIL